MWKRLSFLAQILMAGILFAIFIAEGVIPWTREAASPQLIQRLILIVAGALMVATACSLFAKWARDRRGLLEVYLFWGLFPFPLPTTRGFALLTLFAAGVVAAVNGIQRDESEHILVKEEKIEPESDLREPDASFDVSEGPVLDDTSGRAGVLEEVAPPVEPSDPIRAGGDAVPLAVPSDAIRVGGDVVAPKKLFTPQPQYTEIARKARITGVVTVEAIIDRQGTVTSVRVLKGLPMGLDQAAVDTVKKWKFKPARLNGKPVAVIYNMTVNFQLE